MFSQIPDRNAEEVLSAIICLSEERRLIPQNKRFYSGTIYVVLALEKPLNRSVMLWNVSLLLSDDYLYMYDALERSYDLQEDVTLAP